MCFTSHAFASTKLYTKSHEWVELDEAAKTAVVGLSNYSLKELNDITYIDFPATGTKVEQDGEICSIESVKAVVDFKAPVSGTITEVNSAFEDASNLAKLKNGGAEEADGWFFKLSDVTANKEDLMTLEEFEKFVAES